jgi:hypothetical protein
MATPVRIVLALASAGFVGIRPSAPASHAATCRLLPPFETVQMPAAGVTWRAGEELDGECHDEDDPPERWIRKPLRDVDVMLEARGPEGSGRYWRITIGLGEHGAVRPDRGACVMTLTAGWPILTSFRKEGLPWLEDRDGDGNAEAVIWLSFPLAADGPQWQSGLMGWVYRISPEGVLTLDVNLSRRMAREIAAAYRTNRNIPNAGRANAEYRALRRRAASFLDEFSNARCAL